MILYHDRAIDVLAGTIRARGIDTEKVQKGRRASAEFEEMLSIRNEKALVLRSGSPGHAGLFVQRLRFAEREAQPLQTLAFSARS